MWLLSQNVRCRGCSDEDVEVSSSQQPVPPPPSSHMPDSTTQVIQISRLSFLACGLLFLALASPALAWPEAFAWTLVIPFLVAAWVVRVRTVVGPDGVVARSTFSTTTIPWESLKGIRFPKRGWARATLTDDSEVPLPVVTLRPPAATRRSQRRPHHRPVRSRRRRARSRSRRCRTLTGEGRHDIRHARRGERTRLRYRERNSTRVNSTVPPPGTRSSHGDRMRSAACAQPVKEVSHAPVEVTHHHRRT